MRKYSQSFHDHLQSGATTLCTCWVVARRDGVVMGFTNHDHTLLIDGVSCIASSGLNPTQVSTDLGLSVDNQEIEGALSDDAISDEDLRAGRFDGAKVDIWMVNWSTPDERHLMRSALLGEISREDHYFKAELLGQTALLDQVYGRTYSRICDAILGDDKCGVDLQDPALHMSGEVLEVIDRLKLRCTGLGTFEKNWFAHGQLAWTSGANVGLSVEISGARQNGSDSLQLWKAMPFEPQVGDIFTATTGCDKTFATCRSKFSNQLNFRGCPHMPGADFALGYAEKGSAHDGSPLVS